MSDQSKTLEPSQPTAAGVHAGVHALFAYRAIASARLRQRRRERRERDAIRLIAALGATTAA